jgi:V8-like Glu-specific endopeptidase
MSLDSASYPYDTVVYITDTIGGVSYQASGVLISPDEVLTASHVLYSSSNGTASNIDVVPAYSMGAAPFGSAAGIDVHYFQIQDPNDTISLQQSQFDYAVIHLSRPFTGLGTMGLLEGFQGGVANVTGYPGVADGLMESSQQSIAQVPSYTLFEGTSIGKGSSGGPVWVTENNGSPYVVGVVSSASGGPGSNGFFTQISASAFDQIETWVEQDDAQTRVIWLQNSSGPLALWDMSGTNITGGGEVASNPGPAWHVEGTGDFFGDGNTDILFQNTDGSVALWEMNGINMCGGGLVASNPGPTWQIKSTGDFFSDGNTDIVFQNTDGSVALWDMNGINMVGGGLVASNPGPTWQIKSTGDFFSDGNTDIVFQNTDGSVALWDMNGTSVIGGGLVALDPGPTWHIEGTGDFFGDGNTDIVLQNDDGSVALWDMNGTSVVGGGLVAADPGPTWHIKGTGDFFGDGNTDIVLQNDDGSVALWDMNGTNIVGGGEVANNPGTSWNVLDNIMQFIYSASANETLTATPMTPDEFVFTSFAAGSHTIDGFNPLQDMIEFSKAQFASFSDVQAATSAVSGGAMINLGNGSSLLLDGINPASLHTSDFALA